MAPPDNDFAVLARKLEHELVAEPEVVEIRLDLSFGGSTTTVTLSRDQAMDLIFWLRFEVGLALI